MDAELAEVLLNIRACIQSSKRPVSLGLLRRDYYILVGGDIPYGKFDYSDLESFLKSFDSLEVLGTGPTASVVAKPSTQSQHLTSLEGKNEKPNNADPCWPVLRNQTQRANGDYSPREGGSSYMTRGNTIHSRGDSLSSGSYVHDEPLEHYSTQERIEAQNCLKRYQGNTLYSHGDSPSCSYYEEPIEYYWEQNQIEPRLRDYKTRYFYKSKTSSANPESQIVTDPSNNPTDDSVANTSVKPIAAMKECDCDSNCKRELSAEDFFIELGVDDEIQDMMTSPESGLINLIPEKNKCSVESANEGKVLTVPLVAFEYFGEAQESKKKFYKCKQKCTVCAEDKLNIPNDENSLNKLIEERKKGVFLSRDAIEAINKDLIHDHFKNKWGTENVKMKIARNDHVHQRRPHKQQANQGYNGLNQPADNRDKTVQIFAPQEEDEDNIIDLTKSPREEAQDKNDQSQFSDIKPMDDVSGKFYIDRDFVDVEMYADGLKNDKWNPSQALYEISVKCGWARPKYSVTQAPWDPKSRFRGFVCEGVINGRSFKTEEMAQKKRSAQHMAATKILNYIGFDFECPGLRLASAPFFGRNASGRTDGTGCGRPWMPLPGTMEGNSYSADGPATESDTDCGDEQNGNSSARRSGSSSDGSAQASHRDSERMLRMSFS